MALAENRKIHFDYEIIENYEAGIELSGIEVKSLRTHGAVLDGSYVSIRGGEAFVLNMSIAPYQPGNSPADYDPMRVRKLLLTKGEIGELANMEASKGLTIVPLRVYNKGPKIKIAVGIVRGKKKFDKRADIKKRETDREIERTLKGE